MDVVRVRSPMKKPGCGIPQVTYQEPSPKRKNIESWQISRDSNQNMQVVLTWGPTLISLGGRTLVKQGPKPYDTYQ